MRINLRLINPAVLALALISAGIVEGSRPEMTEDAALQLLRRTLKRDGVYEKRISLDCVEYDTEETTKSYFEFALREIHNAKCGGDPDTSHVLDRYRVYRRSGKIEQYEVAQDNWHAYKSGQTK
jgi:hypothetical protein